MNNNDGYTLPELIILIVFLGIISLVLINKASYAFENTSNLTAETQNLILIKCATAYGNSIIDTIKTEDVYLTGKELEENGYLVDDSNVYTNTKIKLSYDTIKDSINVEIL